MVYGSDIADMYRRVAGYTDQILRGRKPGEIPIYLESKFELLVNLKAAKTLGLTIPTSLLVRADDIPEYVEAARSLGLHAVQYLNPAQLRAELRALEPTLEL